PGCRTRLINGVVISKATIFLAAGLVLGLAIGGAGGFLMSAGGSAKGVTPPVIAAASASAAPPTSAPPSVPSVAPATQAPTAVSIPAVTRSALIQAVETNKRLAASGKDLDAALTDNSFDASDDYQALRAMSADAVFAEQVATHVRDWSGSSEVGAKLVD